MLAGFVDGYKNIKGLPHMHPKKIEEKIINSIQEITQKKLDLNEQVCLTFTNKTREYRIKKILIFSSSYDFFLLEEEGRLRNLFSDWSTFSESYTPPTITHIESQKQLLERLDQTHFDLIILFNSPQQEQINELSKDIKGKSTAPIVILHNNIHELNNNSSIKEHIDKCFTWNGDGKIIISIVQYYEDAVNIQTQKQDDLFRCIFLIEDSIQFYSSYFTIYTEELYRYLKQTITDDINCEQREYRFNQRPYLIHTDTFDEAITLFNTYKEHIQCIISDNRIKGDAKEQIGVKLANTILDSSLKIPLLIQSSEPIDTKELKDKKTRFISKNSSKLMSSIKTFIKKQLGPNTLSITNSKKQEEVIIKSIYDLKNSINHLHETTLLKHAKNQDFSRWLYSIGELELSSTCKRIEIHSKNGKELKTDLIEMIETYQYSINQSAISSFSQRLDDPSVKISRIGQGALGGKARGIAFLAKIISKYRIHDLFPKLKITIPRSIVLSTDVFDLFIEYNNLSDIEFSHLSDERISSKFIKASLPPTVLGDLRSFIRNTRKPLIIRSSGLLEDSLMQPFAGIYASMLLPNDSWETDLRFQEVCNAIKHVFSSTYFERARTYIKSTPKHLADEKMAVLIQEIVGERHGNYFYPTISGVAKSYNYYPSSSCNPEEGITYLALGLGKAIVDGGSSFAFCPQKPKKPLSGSAKEYMKYAQSSFYALNLQSIYKYVNVDEETSLDSLELTIAKKHGVLDQIVSTYIYQDDQIYPGIYEGGPLIVDFGPIIQYNVLPIPKAVHLLLTICEIILGYPVEIEFAVNVSKKEDVASELVILQIRSMIPPNKQIDIDIDAIDKKSMVVHSENCLGNGITSDIYDIVYVDQESFDMSKSIQVVDQIRKINETLMNEEIPYILIGPGRWGSSDQWLGIPVQWSNIAGAQAIIETPYRERHIDPSQGSHFFHDMIASDVMYLITRKQEDIDWDFINNQNIVENKDFIRHVKSKVPLDIIVDGKKGKGVVIQKNE